MSGSFDAPNRKWVWPVCLLVVTMLALWMRWYFVTKAMVVHPLRGDAQHYYFYAWNLVHHGVFSGSFPDAAQVVADSYRDPGFPLLMAFWIWIFPVQAHWYAAVLLTQALLGALTVTMAMQLGRHWMPWRWVLAAGVLMSIWPHSVAFTAYLLTETLFGFLCVLAMVVCARACRLQSTPWAVVAGLCFGTAALTNAVLLPFGVLLALWLAWRGALPRRAWLALLVAAVLLPGMWAMRNTQLPPVDIANSSTGRALQNLVQGSWPDYHAAYIPAARGNSVAQHVMDEISSEIHQVQQEPARGARQMLHRMSSRPMHFVAWYALEKPRLLWGWRIRMGNNDIYVYPTANSPFDHQVGWRLVEAFCKAINPMLALLALACLVGCLVLAWRRRGRPDASAMLPAVLLLAGYATLVYTALQSEPRYGIPFRSFEILLALTALSAAWRWVWARRQVR